MGDTPSSAFLVIATPIAITNRLTINTAYLLTNSFLLIFTIKLSLLLKLDDFDYNPQCNIYRKKQQIKYSKF